MAKVISETPLNNIEAETMEALSTATIQIFKRITSGRSGASVFFAMIFTPEKRMVVAKVQPLSEEGDEYQFHTTAKEIGKRTDTSRFIPDIVEIADAGNGWYCILYEIAGNSLLHSTTLNGALLDEAIQPHELPIICSQVSELIFRWNALSDKVALVSPAATLKKMLGKRNDDKLKKVFEDLGISRTDKWLGFEGHGMTLPNPYAFLDDMHWAHKQITDFEGPSHGDLHGENIIISSYGFSLIDFGEMQNDINIFYDIRYLELHLLMDFLLFSSDYDKQYWGELCGVLTQSDDFLINSDLIPPGKGRMIIFNSIPQLRSAIHRIFSDRPVREIAEIPFYLAGVASGLNFMRKTKDPNKRIAALMYASYNLMAAMKHKNISLYKPSSNKPVPWMQQEIDKLAEYLRFTNIFNNHDNIALVIGPNLLKHYGFLSDYEIASQYSNGIQFDSELDLLDYAFVNNEHSTPNLLMDFVNRGGINSNNDLLKSLKLLLKPKWSSILNWGLSIDLHTTAIELNPDQEYLRLTGENDLRYLRVDTCAWINLRGDSTDADTFVLGLNQWKNKRNSRKRDALLEGLFSFYDYEPTFLLLGFAEAEAKLLIDEFKAFLPRSKTFIVGPRFEGNWNKPSPEFIGLSIEQTLEAFAQMPESKRTRQEVSITFHHPHDGLKIIQLLQHDFDILSRNLEILHDHSEAYLLEGEDKLGKFYFGHTISWTEISRKYDINRDVTQRIERQLIEDLEAGNPYRLNLVSERASGSTTIGRRVAWDIYNKKKVPVVMIKEYTPDLIVHLQVLKETFKRSFLIIADEDFISVDESEFLFDSIQANRIQAVMLRIFCNSVNLNLAVSIEEYTRKDLNSQSKRSFYLEDRLVENEYKQLVSTIGRFVPSVQDKPIPSVESSKSLFLTMLSLFERDFVTLDRYVSKSLEGAINRNERKILVNLALCSLFSKRGFSANFIANTFNINHLVGVDEKVAFVDRTIKTYLNKLFIYRETQTGSLGYTARHPLLAERIIDYFEGKHWRIEVCKLVQEILRALPVDGPGKQSSIHFCYALLNGSEQRIRNALDRYIDVSYFISFVRTHVASQLKDVFELCSKKYKEELHLRAHLAKYYYEFTTDYEQARRELNEILEDNERDTTLTHMMGMTYKREIEYKNKLTNVISVDEFIKLLSNARNWFHKAWTLSLEKPSGAEPQSVGAYVGTIIDFIINAVRKGILNYGDFHLMKLLDQAEAILGEAKFYLDYSESDYLAKLESRLDTLRSHLDVVQLRSISEDGHSQSVLISLLYKQAISFTLHSQERTQELNELISEIDHLRKRSPSESLDLWWAEISLRTANPRLEEIEEVLLRQSRPTLKVHYLLMCTQFSLLLKNMEFGLFERYKKSKENCTRMSQNLAWKRKRMDLLGDDYQLIKKREIGESTVRLLKLNNIVVSEVGDTLRVHPFLGVGETISAYRNKELEPQSVQRGNKVAGFIGFSFEGPQIFHYHSAME
ncbi:hypothetical protein [Cohnella lupini]|uniref:Phosphotransferase family enzyme n=1 Tax=Cohnella lupini TaxID=1294267 RepID=A0A3D9HP54_9BACL|nr:hypothetical protein [Cohnella lupini]RED51195.1 hypothetical protein DFP95_14312 [Cohnella lupini]